MIIEFQKNSKNIQFKKIRKLKLYQHLSFIQMTLILLWVEIFYFQFLFSIHSIQLIFFFFFPNQKAFVKDANCREGSCIYEVFFKNK